MKKLISVFLAAVLVLSVCSVVLAEGSTIDTTTTVGAAGWSVTWKDIFMAESTDPQNLPAATFNYAIAAGEGAAATTSSPKITAGVMGTNTPTITNAVHAETSVGTLVDTAYVTADFTGVPYTEAGIYRYNVTETKGTSSSAADIEIDVENGNKGTYVLDVYVQKNTDGTFSPYAYVLSKAGKIQKFEKQTVDGVVTWVATYDGKTDKITNELTTYDLTITKVIEGSAAANEFEFAIEIIGVPTDVFIKQDSNAAVRGGDNSFTATLGNGVSTTIKGLPSTAGYNIKEVVNQLEGYEVTVTVNGTESTDKTYHWIGAEGQGVTFGSEVNTTGIVMGAQNNTIVFTNLLNNISPTGVVLRVAPYALILIAGVALLLISHRRRTEKE